MVWFGHDELEKRHVHNSIRDKRTIVLMMKVLIKIRTNLLPIKTLSQGSRHLLCAPLLFNFRKGPSVICRYLWHLDLDSLHLHGLFYHSCGIYIANNILLVKGRVNRAKNALKTSYFYSAALIRCK